MDIQEQEHWDYEMGAADELTNARSLSLMERPADDAAKISDLVKAGKFVVVEECSLYCPRTDAGIGSARHIISTHENYADAEQAMNSLPFDDMPEDIGLYILPRKVVQTPVVPYDESDIPF